MQEITAGTVKHPVTPTTGTRRAKTRTSRALAVLAATGAALLGWLVADPLLGIDLTVQSGDAATVQHVGPVAVAAGALVSGLCGWGLLAGLERFTARARRLWQLAALLSLALSMGGPFEALSTAATLTLVTLHVVVGATLIALLPRTTVRGAPKR